MRINIPPMISRARSKPLILKAFFLFVLAFSGAAGSTLAADLTGEGPAVTTPNMTASLVSDYISVSPGQEFTVALRQQIRPHWHTYWKNPGDSGEPTTLDWSLPEGWDAGEIKWPTPHRIAVGPLVNFGYSDEVLLQTKITVPNNIEPGGQVNLQANAFWLVCEEVCIPEEGDLSLAVRVRADAEASDWKARLDQARSELPRPLPWAAKASLSNGQLSLSVPLSTGTEVSGAVYFPNQKDIIQPAAEQVFVRDEDGFTLTVPTRFGAEEGKLDGLLVLSEQTGFAGEESLVTRAYDVDPDAPMLSSPAPTGESASKVSWAAALLMAFVGGLILNLMPCVFPVLSIKVLSLVQMADSRQARIKHAATHGWLYAAGVLSGFMVLAGILIWLRNSGVASGWGFHLQNPLLVLILVWLFFVIGLSLSGMFELGGRFMGLGQNLTQGHGLRKSFFTGLLATVVASPCSAPFMGAALGYALLQPPFVTLSVFVLLGLGMATPFILLCQFPGWLRRLPAPGLWMQRFKELLAFPMYASAVWLLWVLTQQVGDIGVLTAAGGAVLITWIVWLTKVNAKPWRYAGQIAALVILFSGITSTRSLFEVPDSSAQPSDSAATAEQSDWKPFSQEALQQAREEGPVFVNFTADWCITCKANELVALETEKVRALFKARKVTKLKADWTRRDETIANTIESFNRSGVPLYLWYGNPDSTSPEILPQLLTEQMLIERLQALPQPRS